MPFALGTGYLEYNLLSIEGNGWVLPSCLMAVGVIPASIYFIDRDMSQRRQMIHHPAG